MRLWARGLGRAAPALTLLQEVCTAKPCPARPLGRVCRGAALGVRAVPSTGAPGVAGMLWVTAPASRSRNTQSVGEKPKKGSTWEKSQGEEYASASGTLWSQAKPFKRWAKNQPHPLWHACAPMLGCWALPASPLPSGKDGAPHSQLAVCNP